MSRCSRWRPLGARAALLLALGACGDDDRLRYDSRPIAITRAPLGGGEANAPGALLAAGARGGPALILVDTASPYSARPRGACTDGAFESAGAREGTLQIADAAAGTGALRAAFENVPLVDLCPFAVGDEATRPGAILGGDLLRRSSVRLELPRPGQGVASLSLWDELPAPGGALGAVGHAVIRFRLRGGGEVRTGGDAIELTATRVVLRACGAPAAFDPAEAQQSCPSGQLFASASGVPLALALATGTGPLVLRRSAWRRLAARLPGVDPEAGPRAPLHWAQRPVEAQWVTVPRLALVDQQLPSDENPGACAELARARRIEWVERRLAAGACFERCDADGGRGTTSAAYLEIGGGVTTAVVEDDDEVLAGISADIGVAEPKLDGLVGAGALTGLRLEIDYQNTPEQRLVASCLPQPDLDAGLARQRCWASPSCPRLTDAAQRHHCFGLPAQGRAPVCPDATR